MDGGWHKTRVFGRVAYVHRRPDASLVLLAMRVGNVPLGIPFRAHGSWAVIDIEEH